MAKEKNNERKCYSSMDEVLLFIVDKYGVEIFENKTKLVNMFNDLAPQLKNESKLLEFALKMNAEKYYIDIVYAGTRTAPARSIDRTLPEKNRTVLY